VEDSKVLKCRGYLWRGEEEEDKEEDIYLALQPNLALHGLCWDTLFSHPWSISFSPNWPYLVPGWKNGLLGHLIHISWTLLCERSARHRSYKDE
jgi:hypothetical protein